MAKLAGYTQIIIALLGFAELIRRFITESQIPDFSLMIIVSVFALIANTISLLVLQKSKSNEAHIKASLIFTSNDVIINLGVISAGILVYLTNSGIPDLLIGTIVFVLALIGVFKILFLG